MGKTSKKRLPVPPKTISEQDQSTHKQVNETTLEEKLKAFDPVKHGGEWPLLSPTRNNSSTNT